MNFLEEKILKDGRVLRENIVKVDTFLNHQIDTRLMYLAGEEFYNRFKSNGITKIITIEASGIAPAMTAAYFFKVPVVFAKKYTALNIVDECYKSEVYSFTKKNNYDIIISKMCLDANDTVLIIDDFLATGNAIKGLTEIIKQSGAKLAGVGILIEKTFQDGGKELREKGIRIESIAKIKAITNSVIEFEK